MIVQGSEEWFAARAGKVTASRVADVTARTKTGYGASRANYAAQLVAERLTGRVEQGFTNAAMQWGTDQEPFAREAYEYQAGVFVDQVGFVDHPAIDMTGASPDGLIGTEGMVEIKCPNTATHIETLLSGKVPAKYQTQMAWQMACAGRAWCDFVSFDPRLPPHMSLFVQRYERDDEVIAELEREVSLFLAEVESTVSALRQAYPEPQAIAA